MSRKSGKDKKIEYSDYLLVKILHNIELTQTRKKSSQYITDVFNLQQTFELQLNFKEIISSNKKICI